MTVTFIGHRDTSLFVYCKLKNVLLYLVKERGAENFYVGNHGNFDYMVKKVLKKIKKKFPHIKYTVVCAYYNGKLKNDEIIPDNLMGVPERKRIIERNKWMIERADAVVVYVNKEGCSKMFKGFAQAKGKEVINIADFLFMKKIKGL